jgi:hypothetical protein
MPTTATITPTLGSAPVTLQAGNYSAIDDRRFWSYGNREGVELRDSYEVIQRAAGANMTVDVVSSGSGGAVVQGDSVTAQGRYYVPPTPANVNVDIATADATNPRNDLVVLEVKDDQHDASGLNLARVRVITGTPNASAALTSAFGVNGTPALPSTCLPLAVVRVGAGATSITTAAINDRRTWYGQDDWVPTLYTPTLTAATTNPTLGSGSVQAGEYVQTGRTVHGFAQVSFGTSGTAAGSGTYYVSLPVAAWSTTITIGSGFMQDQDTGARKMCIPFTDTSTRVQIFYEAASGFPSVSNSAPWTWAAQDSIWFNFTYRAA